MKHTDRPTENSESATSEPASKPAHDEVAEKAYALYEE